MLDNYRDLIDELLGAPKALRDLLGSADPLPSAATRLLADLRDRDTAVLARLQTMTREHGVFLPVAVDIPGPASDGAALLDEFDTARGELVSLLMNLTLRDWERTAIDATAGEITVADEVERHVEFDEAQRERLGRAIGG
ncbi:MAG: hypothetical protein AVDCRST_MAG19-442 [uncultured Thermomicrobiales bacterium]|uniref:Uncharacterized protein n=1 Tax=uncultured Thermomicrobiales bacterium TaxID=1645740 RepID=A0A6J4UGU7_9BACT|nr:MAG: hypothetical protein AVDCRST_MAG19-442 [uncultured Thermomicrobiales bacterium]